MGRREKEADELRQINYMPGQRTQYRRSQGQSGQLPLEFSYAHVQPQATEVEKAVLGALMIDKDAFLIISGLSDEEL
jgi:replicative DNA helicase